MSDISRDIFDPRKDYVGVVLQQGRMLTDSDFNASEQVVGNRIRQGTIDIVGPFGSSNNGLKISNPSQTGPGRDFEIGEGTFFLGGYLLDVSDGLTYRDQPNWLYPNDAVDASILELVWVEAWEQSVSATEDSELIDPSLGGVDTSGRTRLMHRIHRAPTSHFECRAAWSEAVASLAERGFGRWNDRDAMLEVDAQLTVGFDPGSSSDDWCQPDLSGGYSGRENQTVRLKVIAGGRFVWGFENGQPIYRANETPESTPGNARIELKTFPRDPEHWPLAGEIVELVPFAAQLSNGEFIGETDGVFTTVTTAYSAVAHQFEVRTDAETDAFFAQHGSNFYVRVWRQDSTDGEILAFMPGETIELGGTGLTATIDGSDMGANPYWVFSARPRTQHKIQPWSLMSGGRPNGVRRFVAPLALINWETLDVVDCRPTFRPLTEQTGCCKVTVGDGSTSHGDVDSLQEAVAMLPKSGGTICVLRGRHRGELDLSGTLGITISGCGRESVIEVEPTVDISNSSGLTLRSLVFVGDSDPLIGGDNVTGLTVDGCQVLTNGGSALRVEQADSIQISNNEFFAQPSRTALQRRPTSIVLGGERLAVTGNLISAPSLLAPENEAWQNVPSGGLQILGNSSDVEIRNNTISGGAGDGVMLGHTVLVRGASRAARSHVNRLNVGNAIGAFSMVSHFSHVEFYFDQGCFKWRFTEPPRSETGAPEYRIESGGPVQNVVIMDNDIRDCGGGGVHVLHVRGADTTILGRIVDATIVRNRISSFGRIPFQNERNVSAGISLGAAQHVLVESNRVDLTARGHGRSGIDIGIASGVVLRGNDVLDQSVLGEEPVVRYGAGIRVRLMVNAVQRAQSDIGLTVADNQVTKVVGRALEIRGYGDCVIQNNKLHSHFAPDASLAPLLARIYTNMVGNAAAVATHVAKPVMRASAVEVMMTRKLLEHPGKLPVDFATQSVGRTVRFEGNQVRYEGDPRQQMLPFIVALQATFDVTCANNHISYSSRAGLVYATTLLMSGLQSRSTANTFFEELSVDRQMELRGSANRIYSLVALSRFRTSVTSNVSNLCIHAQPRVVFENNSEWFGGCKPDNATAFFEMMWNEGAQISHYQQTAKYAEGLVYAHIAEGDLEKAEKIADVVFDADAQVARAERNIAVLNRRGTAPVLVTDVGTLGVDRQRSVSIRVLDEAGKKIADVKPNSEGMLELEDKRIKEGALVEVRVGRDLVRTGTVAAGNGRLFDVVLEPN